MRGTDLRTMLSTLGLAQMECPHLLSDAGRLWHTPTCTRDLTNVVAVSRHGAPQTINPHLLALEEVV